MRISVEISMYSFSPDYKRAIRAFIERINEATEIETRVNGMSTQIFGEFDVVMPVLTEAIKFGMSHGTPVSFVTKILGADVSDYEFSKKH